LTNLVLERFYSDVA